MLARRTAPDELVLEFANDPRRFGSKTHDAMQPNADHRLDLSSSQRRAHALAGSSLQGRLHTAETLADATLLLDDAFRWAGTFLRDSAQRAESYGVSAVASRRLRQMQALEASVTDLKSTSQALAPNQPLVQVIYMKKATSALLGVGSSSEEAQILREAARLHRPPPAPRPPPYHPPYTPPTP